MSDQSQGPGWWYASDGKWYPPEQAVSDAVRREMTGGHDRLIRLALAHVGQLP